MSKRFEVKDKKTAISWLKWFDRGCIIYNGKWYVQGRPFGKAYKFVNGERIRIK